MKKPAKIVLGLLTLWPILYMVIFMAVVSFLVFYSQGKQEPTWIGWLFAAHFLTILLIFALLVIYIRNVFKNDRVDKDKKALWAVVLFLGNAIAMPVYWYLYIWRES